MRLTRETSAVTRDTCRTVLHRTVFCTFVSSRYCTHPANDLVCITRQPNIRKSRLQPAESAAKITRVPSSTFSRETFGSVRLQTAFFTSATCRSWQRHESFIERACESGKRYTDLHICSSHSRFLTCNFTQATQSGIVSKIIKKHAIISLKKGPWLRNK